MSLWGLAITVMVAAVINIGQNCDSSPIKKSAADSTTITKTEIGMAKKLVKDMKMSQPIRRQRRGDHGQQSELEDDQDHAQMVTIDLSALRPSLPGLVLYKYGDMAPKLVQIDLDALNPELQPHVVWPEFQQQMTDMGPEFFDVVNLDENGAIPYLHEGDSLAPAFGKPRMAKMMVSPPDWPNMEDWGDSDVYDFLPNSLRNEELMSLHQSLPLADEVIVPLDWEEDDNKGHGTSSNDKSKKNVFISQAWTPGGQLRPRIESATKQAPRSRSRGGRVVSKIPQDITYTSPFGSSGWRPGKRHEESDNEDDTDTIEKEGEPTETDFKSESTVSKSHTVTSAHKKNMYRSRLGPGKSLKTPQQSGKIHKSSGTNSGGRTPSRSNQQGQGSWVWTPQQFNLPQLFSTNW